MFNNNVNIFLGTKTSRTQRYKKKWTSEIGEIEKITPIKVKIQVLWLLWNILFMVSAICGDRNQQYAGFTCSYGVWFSW